MVTMSGHVYAMGSNAYGKLGVNIPEDQNGFLSTPKLVDLLNGHPIASVSCGWNHTAAISKGGECFTWGQSEYGQLGRHYQADQIT